MSDIIISVIIAITIIMSYVIGWKESKKATRIEFRAEIITLIDRHQKKALQTGNHADNFFVPIL